MAGAYQSLWPDDVEQEDVLTPLEILEFQARELERISKGRLTAEIETFRDVENEVVTHNFEIVAPRLDRYRYRMFRASHVRDQVYPATIFSQEFEFDIDANEFCRVTSTQDEFASAVELVLKSSRSRSVIQSLLAQINSKARSKETAKSN